MFAQVLDDLDALSKWRNAMADSKIVATNGCFDLLHRGHVEHLWEARKLGEIVVVGLNGDESVRILKGPGRPVQTAWDRAYILSALRPVGLVFIFLELRATKFIEALRPDIYVKGGDYTPENMEPTEMAALSRCNATVRFLPRIGDYSTSAILAK